MNGEMDVSTKDKEWSQDNLLHLLEAMKVNIPMGDLIKYKNSVFKLDWEKVAFKSFTGEMCKKKWNEISKEIRKFRTLKELIFDAQDLIRNPRKGKQLKNHPDFPKRPLTPYFRFFKEQKEKYDKLHPEMSNLELTKILSMEYSKLPEINKKKYIEEFQKEKEIFTQTMLKFREEHPELLESMAKTSNSPEKPVTPQQLWMNHEKEAYLKTHPQATTKDVKASLRNQWTQLSDEMRLTWIAKSLEINKANEEKMKGLIQTNPELNMAFPKSTLTKAERQLKDKSDGRPDKPPSNGYAMFCDELMSSMKDVPSTDRVVICSQQWKLLKKNEKDAYQKRCEQRKKEYQVEMDRFLCKLSKEEQQRVLGELKMSNVSASKRKSKAKKRKSTVKPGGAAVKVKAKVTKKSDKEDDEEDELASSDDNLSSEEGNDNDNNDATEDKK